MTRDEFASLVAHELRNPLNAASGWLHLLASENGRIARRYCPGGTWQDAAEPMAA